MSDLLLGYFTYAVGYSKANFAEHLNPEGECITGRAYTSCGLSGMGVETLARPEAGIIAEKLQRDTLRDTRPALGVWKAPVADTSYFLYSSPELLTTSQKWGVCLSSFWSNCSKDSGGFR